MAELIIHAVPTMSGLLVKDDKTLSYNNDGLLPPATFVAVSSAVLTTILVVVAIDDVVDVVEM